MKIKIKGHKAKNLKRIVLGGLILNGVAHPTIPVLSIALAGLVNAFLDVEEEEDDKE